MNLNQVTVPVRDIAAAREFYLQLGLILVVDSAHYARFLCTDGDSTFSIIHDPDHKSNGSTIYFELDNLDEKVKELQDKGLEFLEQPSDKHYLWREAIIVDPSGNAIKLYHAGENRKNPPWRVK